MSFLGKVMVTAPPGSLKQERIFFNTEWKKEIDDRFIRALMRQHVNGNKVVDGPNRKAINFACSTVNREFGTTFDYEYCVIQYRKLRKRYKVFNWMVETEGVSYDSTNNVVHAEIATWERFFREEKLSKAYGRTAELQYASLWNLFSGDSEVDDWMAELERKSGINPNRKTILINHDPEEDNHSGSVAIEYETSTDSFCYELAWYKNDSDGDSDAGKWSTSTAISTSNRAMEASKHEKPKT